MEYDSLPQRKAQLDKTERYEYTFEQILSMLHDR